MTFKVIRQHDDRDCGAACLAMIARHYGRRLPLPEARRLTDTGTEGANLYGLVAGAESLGFDAAGLAGSSQDLVDALSSGLVRTPFIAHVRENNLLHYVVVTRMAGTKVRLADPARGVRRMSLTDFGVIWTGHVVVPKMARPLADPPMEQATGYPFWSLLKGQRRWVLAVLLLSLVMSAIGAVGAFSFQLVIDGTTNPTPAQGGTASIDSVLSERAASAASHTGWGLLTVVFGSLILLYLLQAAVQYLRGRLIILVSKRIDARLLPDYFDHLIDLPVASVNLRRTGEYMSRISDAAAVRGAVAGAAVSLVLDSTMVVAGAVILYLQGGVLFWLPFVMVVIYVVLILFFRRPVATRARTAMEKDAVMQSYVKEALDGIKTVKSAGAGSAVKNSARRRLDDMIEATAGEGRIAITQETISEAVQLIGTALILWWGFTMVFNGQLSVGELMTFYALLGFFVQPVRNLVDLQPAIQAAFVAASRLNDIFTLKTEESAEGDPLAVPINQWSMDGVDFRYGNGALVLKEVSLRIERGERIGIVGESGSGKTTLAQLFMRFHEPTRGVLTVDGARLDTIRLDDLRRSIAHVEQETFLFADSIADNLRLGSPATDIGDAEIVTACRRAQIADHISSLPMGYGTAISEGGGNFSGGQRQRLAIARALLKSPQLLILDEATSHLDSVTEAALWDSLFAVEDVSFLVIAHRLAAVQRCDRIYVLVKGEVVESGCHADLMAAGGTYAALWANQMEPVPTASS